MAKDYALFMVTILVGVAGCLTPSPEGDASPSPSEVANTTGAPPKSEATTETNGSTTTTGATGTPPPTPTQTPEPLTDFEQAVAKTWRRYHVSNSGERNEYEYYEYVDFEENRTACKWKYGEKSSTSSTDDVFSEGDYPHWEIAEQLSGGGERYRVVVEGRGLDYVFDFVQNRVYPEGSETLVFSPNTDGKSCVHRGGASY
jgi:hypothetical protein